MAKKMSVEEILAAARGGAAKKPAETPPAPAAETPAPATEAAPGAAEAKPKPAAKPGAMSVADILAAAKAGKATPKPAAAATPAAPKPAAVAAEKKPAPPKTDAAVAAAVPKDPASILAAARKGSKPGPVSKAEAEAKGIAPVATGKKKLEVPPMPAKPDFARPAPVAAAAADPSRRTFFAAVGGALFGSSMAIGFTSLAVTNLIWLLGLARFMFPNILIEPPMRFKVGPKANFGPGQVETKFIPEFGVWIVRYEYEGQPMIYALKAVCTHLGCTPNWLEAEQKFKCPCHGSGFYKDGVNFEGPAPRPLERYAIAEVDGQLEVDKSRTFNQEQGQWKDAASFVTV